MDLDTKYYKRFPEELIEKIWKRIERNRQEQKVIYKNDRLYIIENGVEIICPNGMYNMYFDFDNKSLDVTIRWF